MKKRTVLLSIPLFILVLTAGCGNIETVQEPESYTFPAERPDIPMPDIIDDSWFSSQLNIIDGQKIGYTGDIDNLQFYNCEVSIKGTGITVMNCRFINSIIYLENSTDVLFTDNVVTNLDAYEKTALVISGSENITVRNCMFEDNYIGLGVHVSSVNISENRFYNNNGHNALVINDGSTAEVSGNYFYGSFPHAILILNREADPRTAVDIHHNIIDQTGEDAINFEDFSNAAPSRVCDNIITNTGWAAILVEYNSWESNITIETNWIEGTGIEWQLPLHPSNPEEFLPGWGHGILIEDSSMVTVSNNRILGVNGNGIEITNGRDIFVTENGISCHGSGIGVHAYNEASLSREYSPLKPGDVGGSRAEGRNNTIFEAQQDYEVDELSEIITLP